MEYQPNDFLTTDEISKYYGISKPTVYNRKSDMKLISRFQPAIKFGGRKIRFKELDEFFAYFGTPECRNELNRIKTLNRSKK